MRMFLPILWFVLNVLSFNTLTNPYEQNTQTTKESTKAFWSQSSSDHSSNKNSQIYFLPEEFEENVEEDVETDSDIQFIGCDLNNSVSLNSFLAQLEQSHVNTSIFNHQLSVATTQAKFILYQNFRI